MVEINTPCSFSFCYLMGRHRLPYLGLLSEGLSKHPTVNQGINVSHRKQEFYSTQHRNSMQKAPASDQLLHASYGGEGEEQHTPVAEHCALFGQRLPPE
jgi:hypothetical protein